MASEEQRTSRRRKRAKKVRRSSSGSTGLFIGLGVAGACLLIVLVIAAGGGGGGGSLPGAASSGVQGSNIDAIAESIIEEKLRDDLRPMVSAGRKPDPALVKQVRAQYRKPAYAVARFRVNLARISRELGADQRSVEVVFAQYDRYAMATGDDVSESEIRSALERNMRSTATLNKAIKDSR